jgi:hypothetical protein
MPDSAIYKNCGRVINTAALYSGGSGFDSRPRGIRNNVGMVSSGDPQSLLSTWLLIHHSDSCHIQGVPGGTVNILGCHSIGHSKQKSVNVQVSCSERFPR